MKLSGNEVANKIEGRTDLEQPHSNIYPDHPSIPELHLSPTIWQRIVLSLRAFVDGVCGRVEPIVESDRAEGDVENEVETESVEECSDEASSFAKSTPKPTMI